MYALPDEAVGVGRDEPDLHGVAGVSDVHDVDPGTLGTPPTGALRRERAQVREPLEHRNVGDASLYIDQLQLADQLHVAPTRGQVAGSTWMLELLLAPFLGAIDWIMERGSMLRMGGDRAPHSDDEQEGR